MPRSAGTPRPQLTRAARILIDDATRSDAIIAAEAGVSRAMVWRARAMCEQMGLIPVVAVADRERRPDTQPSPARDAVALLGPGASIREVAATGGVSLHAAWKQLRRANPRLGDVAAAAETLSVVKMPRQLPDAAAAADAIAVSAQARCERCGTGFSFTPRPNRPARRWWAAWRRIIPASLHLVRRLANSRDINDHNALQPPSLGPSQTRPGRYRPMHLTDRDLALLGRGVQPDSPANDLRRTFALLPRRLDL